MGPCAKQVVKCHIITLDQEIITGENNCANPQEVCPRLPGEDYTKCKIICEQYGHAEANALRKAGDKAKGACAFLEGHTYYCMNCQHLLFEAGIIGLGRPSSKPMLNSSKSILEGTRCNTCNQGTLYYEGNTGHQNNVLSCTHCDNTLSGVVK